MGRIRLHVVLDCTGYSLEAFTLDKIEPGATISTDTWPGYGIIDKELLEHEKTNQHSGRKKKIQLKKVKSLEIGNWF